VISTYKQKIDGRYALDDQTLERVELDEHQEIFTTGTAHLELELDFGVQRYFEVGFVFIRRSAEYDYTTMGEVEGQIAEPISHNSRSWSHQIGGRVSFIPLPSYIIRPTATLGAGYWVGTAIEDVVSLPSYLEPLQTPTMVYLDVGVGGEFQPLKRMMIFARYNWYVPLAGRIIQEQAAGPATLSQRADVTGPGFGGGVGTLGLAVPLGPIGGVREPKTEFDDEEVIEDWGDEELD
jgi:hypothetical protein